MPCGAATKVAGHCILSVAVTVLSWLNCNRGDFAAQQGPASMQASGNLYDPGNAPEILAYSIGKIEVIGPMVSFYLCIPRDVGGERVQFVTAIINMPRDAIAGNIALTELALAAENGHALAS
jgi:hypothetical protein